MKMLVTLLLSLLLMAAAWAGPVRDGKTGLGVGDLSWEFTVTRASKPDGAAFEISRAAWGIGNCKVAFTAVARGGKAAAQPGRAGLLQAAQQELNGNFRMGSVRNISQQGVAGITFTADFVSEFPGKPRHLWTVFETAKGRTAISCYALGSRFDRWRPDFETVTKAVVIPK
ncbi:hypothetical protein C5L14_11845 [Labrys okinawensis]|uniref:Uncharacterized protein n=1 Tax=Labrys okinawensis TaxID=346911 RepID=A0A2S9QD89_9HYPH|nr:hypothetical protein [Labrys okinawensis]PRH87314.1 hypothetical protein C5L14_11845 [Labrys okinawensis]